MKVFERKIAYLGYICYNNLYNHKLSRKETIFISENINMRKIMFIGRSESGKTTLTQALKGEKIMYNKTMYINHFDVVIDTPGEYMQTKNLISALACFTAEADVVGLLMDSTEPYSLYPPQLAPVCNREVVGIVTKMDHWASQPEQAAAWLELAGCSKVFFTSAFTGEGIADIISYLKEERDVLPWEEMKEQYQDLGFGEGESEKDSRRSYLI